MHMRVKRFKELLNIVRNSPSAAVSAATCHVCQVKKRKTRRDQIPITPIQRSDRLWEHFFACLLYTSPSPRDRQKSRMPSSA